jgi:hypothetical protein
MTRLPRNSRLPKYVRGFAVALATVGLPASWAAAQAADPAAPPAAPPAADPAAPAAPPAAAPADPAAPAAPGAAAPGAAAPGAAPAAALAEANPNQNLVNNVENVRHYLLTAQWRLAEGELKQLAGREANVELLNTITNELRKADIDSPDAFLYRFRDRPELKESVDGLLTKLNQVRAQQVRDPAVIKKNVDALTAVNARARAEGLAWLTRAGESAVPEMISRLRDPNLSAQHAPVAEALRAMRGSALSPLLAATEVRDEAVLLPIVRILLDLGYPTEVLPFVVRAAEDPKTSSTAKARLQAELAMRGNELKSLRTGDLFYKLADRFYYNAAAVKPDPRDPMAKVWFWSEAGGLVGRDVPQAAFPDVMAMRCAEAALRADTTGDAVGLWLAANNKREVDLAGQPGGAVYADLDAHFWNVRLGAQHLNRVLVRALRDGDAQGMLASSQRSAHTLVALKAIKSLAEIVGQNSLAKTALPDAMKYSDRQVRYEAALAAAGGLPQQPFPGQERVVLLLAETLAQTGTSGVLVFAKDVAAVNAVAGALKDKYKIAGGTTAAQVINESAQLPSIDAILVADDVDQNELKRLFAAASESARLDRAARVVMVSSRASSWYQIALADSRVNATMATPGTPPELAKAIEEGKARAGGLPLDEKGATEYALRAAAVLNKLAISRGQVLNVAAAEPTVLAALNDARPDLAKASAAVASLIDSARPQSALTDRAVDEKAADDVKVAMYKGLAASAKFFGNRLDEPRVDSLRKAATGEKTAEVKAAAAEALGALNLTAEQVKPLILDRPGAAAGTPVAAQ